MKSPADDIMSMLEGASLGLELSKNMFVGFEPARPDNTVTLYDTVGRPPLLTLDNKKYEYGGVQVRVRNRSYVQAMKQAYEIKDYLHGKYNVEAGDFLYTLVRCNTPPSLMAWDENQRAIIVINFETQRR